MNLISIRKKRRPAIALLLCTGLLGACPPDAVADAGDRFPSLKSNKVSRLLNVR